MSAQLTGIRAEQQACEYLIQQGLICITRNFRCPYGELDLIMDDHHTLIIVEVRYRRSAYCGSPAESVTYAKQQRIIRATQYYLQHHACHQPVRFDVLAMTNQRIDWLQNAFSAD